jgi:hypothetical protein
MLNVAEERYYLRGLCRAFIQHTFSWPVSNPPSSRSQTSLGIELYLLLHSMFKQFCISQYITHSIRLLWNVFLASYLHKVREMKHIVETKFVRTFVSQTTERINLKYLLAVYTNICCMYWILSVVTISLHPVQIHVHYLSQGRPDVEMLVRDGNYVGHYSLKI